MLKKELENALDEAGNLASTRHYKILELNKEVAKLKNRISTLEPYMIGDEHDMTSYPLNESEKSLIMHLRRAMSFGHNMPSNPTTEEVIAWLRGSRMMFDVVLLQAVNNNIQNEEVYKELRRTNEH